MREVADRQLERCQYSGAILPGSSSGRVPVGFPGAVTSCRFASGRVSVVMQKERVLKSADAEGYFAEGRNVRAETDEEARKL
jgi:hypothetical protein